MGDTGKRARDAAEEFGNKVEEIFDDAGDALDALKGKRMPERTSDGDESDSGDDAGDGDITINIDR